jgi:prepilin-type N-terminal cleavage/methylation domain-containing protein
MRRGFTLVEMLVALIVVGLLGQGLYRVLANQQRLAVTQVEQAVLQSNVRVGSLVLANELQELGGDATSAADLEAANPTSVTYRAMRSMGFACQVSPSVVKIRTTPLYGIRLPVAGQDSLLLFVEGDPTISSDDRWRAFPISSVTQGVTCGGVAAISLGTALDSASNADVLVEAPVRTFEIMELGQMSQGGLNWLGARSASAGQALEPVAGPLQAGGLSFAYYDSLGNVTATLARVRSIQMTLRGRSDLSVRAGGTAATVQPVQDSLVRWVTLRNSPLP